MNTKATVLFMLVLLMVYSAVAVETTTDLVTRMTDIKCAGDNHNIEMNWDSAVAAMGPTKFLIDGEDATGALVMSFGKEQITYESRGLKISIADSDKVKSFRKVANLKGRDIILNCSYQEKMKFFRSREVGKPATTNPTAPQSTAR